MCMTNGVNGVDLVVLFPVVMLGLIPTWITINARFVHVVHYEVFHSV